MAEPISRSVSTMPSQDDPASFQWWADYHQAEADKIAAQDAPGTEIERVGQLQGEMDHRAAAAMFLARIERQKDSEYSAKVKAELESRGVVIPPAPSQKAAAARADIIQDTRDAFRDYGIPDEFAEHAVMVGDLDKMPDAADRERFYNNVLDAKRDLDLMTRDNGKDQVIDGVNDWKSVIDAAAARTQSEAARQTMSTGKDPAAVQRILAAVREEMNAASAQKAPKAAADVRTGLRAALEHWTASRGQVREKFPLLQTTREQEKVANAGKWKALLASQLPAYLQKRLGLHPEQVQSNAMEKTYAKIVDKNRDALLSERAKALTTLRGVDTRIPPHLLPSKQYRAAERLTQIDQQLRKLSPLDKGEYRAAADTAGAPQRTIEVAPATTPAQAQTQAPERVSAVQMEPSKHEKALDAVRELMGQTPVDGYRTKAAEAMAKNIVRQLQEGRETIALSTKYAGGDQSQAASTHANAVEANKQLIEAVRQNGIAVDTGRATVASKKVEVEAGQQVGQDLAQDSLQ